MKLGIAERMSPCDGWDEVEEYITLDDSDIYVIDHEDGCRGCDLCRAPTYTLVPWFSEQQ